MTVRNLATLVRASPGVALVDCGIESESTWTGAQFSVCVGAIAGALLARLQPAQPVLIAGGVTSHALAAFLGTAAAGMVAVPLNVKLPAESIRFICEDASIAFALVERGFEHLVPPGLPCAIIDELGRGNESVPPRPVSPDQLLTIMYTAGSTGRPKGVPITHRGYGWAFDCFAGLSDSIQGRTGLVAAPLFHMNGQFHALNMLFCGARVVLLERFSAASFLDAIVRYQVFRVTGVPTMFALAAREAAIGGRKDDFDPVRMVAMGSAPLSRSLLDRVQQLFPNAAITNGYGTTETGPASFGPHPAGLPTPPLSLGYPMRGVDTRLVDGPSDDEGRLLLRSPMTLAAYWNRPELSAARIVEGWYDTGDRLRRDDEGFHYFIGRADDMLLVGGENVFPAEVERLLERHPCIAQAAVVGVPDEIKGEKPVAFVVLEPGASFDEAELKAFTLRDGPAYAHPRRILQVAELPLSAANKVDKAKLRRRFEG